MKYIYALASALIFLACGCQIASSPISERNKDKSYELIYIWKIDSSSTDEYYYKHMNAGGVRSTTPSRPGKSFSTIGGLVDNVHINLIKKGYAGVDVLIFVNNHPGGHKHSKTIPINEQELDDLESIVESRRFIFESFDSYFSAFKSAGERGLRLLPPREPLPL